MASAMLLLTTAALAIIGLFKEDSLSHDDIKYKYPVRSSRDDRIDDLPGLKHHINFKQFSGYLRADEDDKPFKFLHYWLVESQSEADYDPLIVWFQGGPGCSSMVAMFDELGPFKVDDDEYEPVKQNKNSWNKKANVVFIDSPLDAGYSYAVGGPFEQDDDSVVKLNYIALKSLMEKFPQYKNRDIYLAGESYAGVYLATLGVLLDADKHFNLKGIAIGNGFMHLDLQLESLVFFSNTHGFIGQSVWDRISKYCCQWSPPSVESCKLVGENVSLPCVFARQDSTAFQYQGINPYNLYQACQHSTRPSKTDLVKTALMKLITNSSTIRETKSAFKLQTSDKYTTMTVQHRCVDLSNLVKYLNREDVKIAAHIPKGTQDWAECTDLRYTMVYPQQPRGLAPQLQSLMDSKRNLTLLLYNGDVDSVCNFLGNEWFLDSLDRKVLRQFQPWKVGNQVSGFWKKWDGIKFFTVKGAGHMTAKDKPAELQQILNILLGEQEM